MPWSSECLEGIIEYDLLEKSPLRSGVERDEIFWPAILEIKDSIIKHYFNKYRDIGKLPPVIEREVSGWLAVGMPKTLESELDNGIKLWGRPDDYFKLDDGNVIPFDHKTKSKEFNLFYKRNELKQNPIFRSVDTLLSY